jgi:hypothetical protein
MDLILDSSGTIIFAVLCIVWIYLGYIKPYFDEQAALKAQFAAAQKLQATRRYINYAYDGVSILRAIRTGNEEAVIEGLMRALNRE